MFKKATCKPQKNIYADLKVVNLKEQLPYEPEFFDSVISSGTFVQGHCSPRPECIPNIIHVLKKNRYMYNVLHYDSSYGTLKSEWERQIKESGCELVEETEVP